MPVQGPIANRLLKSLPVDEFQLLSPYLEAVDLPLRRPLETRNLRIDHVYFVEHGFASVVADGPGQRSIEVGIIGREGMTGLAVLMGTDRTPYDTYMQSSGSGHRMTSEQLRQGIGQSPALHNSLLRSAHAFNVQTAQTAVANGRHKIEERLARWLLMAQDRGDGDELRITHEFLGLMLAVRRPGVTIALNLLEARGLIHSKRGVILIVDRKGLMQSSNGAYGVPEAEFRRLFG
jgi:CRP-like cAMP-binding protein